MVSIRLSRFGHKKAPFYRVVAVDSKKKQGGMVLEILGTWNPIKNEVDIDKKRVEAWVAKGGQISTPVKNLIK